MVETKARGQVNVYGSGIYRFACEVNNTFILKPTGGLKPISLFTPRKALAIQIPRQGGRLGYLRERMV